MDSDIEGLAQGESNCSVCCQSENKSEIWVDCLSVFRGLISLILEDKSGLKPHA